MNERNGHILLITHLIKYHLIFNQHDVTITLGTMCITNVKTENQKTDHTWSTLYKHTFHMTLQQGNSHSQ